MAVFILLCVILVHPTLANGAVIENSPDFSRMLEEHGAIMLMIDPQSGAILYANKAAAEFYGYTKEQLESMNIVRFDASASHEIEKAIQSTLRRERNYFTFTNRLANGEIRTVQVLSYPTVYGNRQVLFSIVYDITSQVQLQKHHDQTQRVIRVSGVCVILLLTFLIGLTIRNSRKLKARNREIENLNALHKTFMNANDSLIYLKDENLNYVFVNQAVEKYYRKKAEEIIGRNDFTLSDENFANKRKLTDLEVTDKGTLVVDEVEWENRFYKTTKFPVEMLNGKFGIGAYISDVTKEHEQSRMQEKVIQRNMILVDVFNRSFKTRQEQLDFVLHESLKLTESKFGYIYLYDEETKELTLNSWSRDVMAECKVMEQQSKYALEKTGIWGEVIRQRKPIVVNDFAAPNPQKKGYPEGHVQLSRFMSVPVMIEERIVAVIGLANKESDYDINDVYEISLLMSGIWNAVEKREAQEKLSFERNKYLQTLISIGDGVLVVDQNGNIEMLNKVAEELTGWPIGMAAGKPYKEVFVLSHENEQMMINDPIKEVFQTDTVQELGNHAMLTSRKGKKYYLEDSAAPIKDDGNRTVGVVLVFRDVTDKKEQRKKIEYLSFHDSLTGLYNRRFFEAEMERLNTENNLPLSVIMGDINGLKLTNDVFGHAFGDILLENIAKVLRKTCRAGDIVARWGGDEFVLLLPQTNVEEAEEMMGRIKKEFAKVRVKFMQGSISMGCAVKQQPDDDVIETLETAEERMYLEKTLDRSKMKGATITAMIQGLHESSEKEREHSRRVGEMCRDFGRALKLPEVEIHRLKEAGFLHDIGKIVLEPQILNTNTPLTGAQRTEVRRHPTVGYRLLNSFDDTLDLAELVMAHHERWDGTGYPKGLKGEEIPKLARIIALVESYDRMTDPLCGDQIMSKEQAIGEIREKAGSQFDPELTELLIQMIQTKVEVEEREGEE